MSLDLIVSTRRCVGLVQATEVAVQNGQRASVVVTVDEDSDLMHGPGVRTPW